MNQTPQKKGFDPSAVIGQILSHAKYARLALLMVGVGFLAGTVYFTFSIPVFQSRVNVHVQVFDNMAAEGSSEFLPTATRRVGAALNSIRRGVRHHLATHYMISAAAAEVGVVNEGASYEYVRDKFLPVSRISYLDDDILQIEAFATDRKLVREFAEALITVYNREQDSRAQRFRQVMVARYLDEIEDIKAKVAERFSNRVDFQAQNEMLDLFIEQHNLSRVPVEIMRVRSRLGRFAEVVGQLERRQDLAPLEELSLLASVEGAEDFEVGRVVTNPLDRRGQPRGPVEAEADPAAAQSQVVVQPAMIDRLEPWRALERERRELAKEMAEAARTFGPEHRTMRAMRLRMAQIDESLEAELEVARQRFNLEHSGLRERLASLEQQLPQYQEVTSRYQELEQEFQLMEDGQEIWDAAHRLLATRLAAMDYGEDRDRVELTVLGFTQLRDQNPVSPNKAKLLIMSLVMGLGLAVGVPFVLERFNDTTSMLVEVEKATGLNAVGIVPLVERDLLESVVRSPELDKAVPNHLLENFRVIRANIALNPSQTAKSQVIMVTSSRPSEGKTTMSANLGWAFDSVAERTLLIDADTRRGRMHEVLNLPNDRGLSLLLHGRAPMVDVIQKTPLPNLDVITRGPILAGSSEFLCKPVFDDLVKHWRGEYDRIIIDTPPMLGLSEGTSLQRVVDGVLLVVRAESTPKKDIRDAVTMLNKSGAHIFGFVMNRVDLRKLGNYYTYYYYSPRYYDSLERPMDEPVESYPRGYAKA